jgi:serine/threonine protein kinase
MEYVKRGNLRHFIQRYKEKGNSIHEQLLIFLFFQLISVLNYCCNQKIIHGDIKSENILLTESCIIKLAGFGISKILSSQNYECDTASTH